MRRPYLLKIHNAPVAQHFLLMLLPAALAGLPAAAHAAEISTTQLSQVLPDSASASFASAQAPDWVVTVSELGAATLTGSDMFGYEGLWLGSAGQGGDYRVQFSQPVSAFTLSFLALSNLGPDGAESLGAFATSTASSALFSSPDGSAAWDGSTISALEEDSRGALTFTALLPAGFTSLVFSHVQPAQLNGVVIDRLVFEPGLVPEPAAAWLWLGGLAGLAWRARRRFF